MNQKQWYIVGETSGKFIKETIVQYFSTKKDAENEIKQLKNNPYFKFPYIDFVWKFDIEKGIPFSALHGKSIKKVESITDYVKSA